MTMLSLGNLKKKIKTTWINIRFPFFAPRNNRTNKIAWDAFFTQSYWWSIPTGWRNAFGINLAKDFKKAIRHSGQRIFFMHIKQKFGILDITLNSYTDEIFKLISKYIKISFKTCIDCGGKAEGQTRPWILPLCRRCYDNPKRNRMLEFVYFNSETAPNKNNQLSGLEVQNDEYDYGHDVNHKRTNDDGEDI